MSNSFLMFLVIFSLGAFDSANKASSRLSAADPETDQVWLLSRMHLNSRQRREEASVLPVKKHISPVTLVLQCIYKL